MAKVRREAGEVIRALVERVRKHAHDYHHKTDPEVLERAAAFLDRLHKGGRRGVKGEPPPRKKRR
jgi:hypothetical protein